MKNNNVLTMYRYFLIMEMHAVKGAAGICFILAFIAEVTADNAEFLKAYGKETVFFILETWKTATEKGTETINNFLMWFGSAAAFRNEIIAQDKYYEGI